VDSLAFRGPQFPASREFKKTRPLRRSERLIALQYQWVDGDFPASTDRELLLQNTAFAPPKKNSLKRI
jgi:hypothetical protein